MFAASLPSKLLWVLGGAARITDVTEKEGVVGGLLGRPHTVLSAMESDGKSK